MKARTSWGLSLRKCWSDGAPPRCSVMNTRNCVTSRRRLRGFSATCASGRRDTRAISRTRRDVGSGKCKRALDRFVPRRESHCAVPSPFLKRRNRAIVRMASAADRRCHGAGRARPRLYLPGAGGHEPCSGRRRRGAVGPDYTGVVWGEGKPRPGLHNKLKDVDAKLDLPPLHESRRNFIDWVADYTLGHAA